MFKFINKVITGSKYAFRILPLLMRGKIEEIETYLLSEGYTPEEATEILLDIGGAQAELFCKLAGDKNVRKVEEKSE